MAVTMQAVTTQTTTQTTRPSTTTGRGTARRLDRVPRQRGRADRPTGVERELGENQLIVTKTDLRGRITYANDVFLQISALEEHEALGQPHSLIRHPDMPRGLFALLWSTIEAGEEIFAYIANLASDGARYWVLAHVTPSCGPGGEHVGYHSNRRRPARAGVVEAERLYARLRRAEQGLAARDAADAGRAELERFLAEQGATYSEWLWSIEEEA